MPSTQVKHQLDWSLQDSELAARTGYSREWIRLLRAKYGRPCPNPGYHWKIRHKVDEVLARVDVANLPLADIARIAGVSTGCKYLADEIKRRAIPTGRRSFAYLINWKLTNKDLSEVWGSNWIGTYRYRERAPAAEIPYLGPKSTNPVIEEERHKARAWKLKRSLPSLMEKKRPASKLEITH